MQTASIAPHIFIVIELLSSGECMKLIHYKHGTNQLLVCNPGRRQANTIMVCNDSL